MNLPISVTQSDLLEILLNIAPVRPVFIWGAPGIGKSALVEQFAEEVGLDCVSLLGSQLAPEDIIGIPQIKGETSEFLPPKMIARKEPYVLFLDELNACSQEVQKAFYSLIHEKRIGEYHLPEGSVVIGAGNRAQDSAIVKTMSSALVNRMFHVQLKADPAQWLAWAYQNGIVNGYADGSFGVDDYITREQIAKMLKVYADLKRYNTNTYADLNSFPDAADVSGWAVRHMQWAVGSGMINGKRNPDGNYYLDAKGNATRAECAAMLMRFIQKYNIK